MAHPPRRQGRPKPGINDTDRKYLEQALSALPAGPMGGGEGYAQADGLLKFGYHQNPYVRAFTKILWSAYALSRGQVADCHARFKQAHRDAQMSNIDEVTIRTLDDASASLERAMAPDGSISLFLQEMRGNTMRRVWARVCETSLLPPPSFRAIFADDEDAMTVEEMEAAEAAEIAALMIDSEPEDDAQSDGQAPDDDESAEAGDEDAQAAAAPADQAIVEDGDVPRLQAEDASDAASGDNGAHQASKAAPAARAVPVARDEAPSSERDSGRSDDEGPQPLNLERARSCSTELAAETLASLTADMIKELRVAAATGELRITISVQGESSGQRSRRRGRRRRR